MKIKNIAKTVVLNTAGQVLLLRRSPTDSRRPGEWDFPGGGVDAGEDFAVAAVREIAEEAGLTVQAADLRLIYTATEWYQPSGENINRLLFMTRLSEGPGVSLSFEHDQFKWVDIDTALTEFPHPVYGKGLAHARDHGLL